MKKITISDIALKVCAKQNGGYYTFREKLNIAKYIANAKVDAIELPEIKKEREDVIVYKTISESIGDTVIKIDGGITDESILRTSEVVNVIKNGVLQIVLPISTVQMEYTYHKKSVAMLPFIENRIAYAKTLSNNVEFVALDASRADKSFLIGVVKSVEKAGATSITICDDACEWMPEDVAKTITEIVNVISIPLSVKVVDKIGIGIAVLASSIKAGASGVITSAIKSDTVGLVDFADFIVAKAENINASAKIDHTAIHRDFNKMAKAEDKPLANTVGSVKISITKESTLSDITKAIESLGYEVTEADVGKVFEETKRILNCKSVIEARELEVIIATTAMQVPSTYHLESYVVNCGNIINATAQITLVVNGEKFFAVGAGDGPIDASFNVIEQIVGHQYELDDFQVQTVTEGRESVGHALVKLRSNGKLYSGNGVSTDIVGASVRAYLNALNKVVFEEK